MSCVYRAVWSCRPVGSLGLRSVRKVHTFTVPEQDPPDYVVSQYMWDTAPQEWWETHEHFTPVSCQKVEV